MSWDAAGRQLNGLVSDRLKSALSNSTARQPMVSSAILRARYLAMAYYYGGTKSLERPVAVARIPLQRPGLHAATYSAHTNFVASPDPLRMVSSRVPFFTLKRYRSVFVSPGRRSRLELGDGR